MAKKSGLSNWGCWLWILVAVGLAGYFGTIVIPRWYQHWVDREMTQYAVELSQPKPPMIRDESHDVVSYCAAGQKGVRIYVAYHSNALVNKAIATVGDPSCN